MEKVTWCYSYNEENFHGDFETREEALAEALECSDGEHSVIYLGNPEKPSLSVSADRILDDLAESAYEQCGEYAEGYLAYVHKNKEAYNALDERINDVVQAWMKRFGYEPYFYKVVNVEEVRIKEGNDE